MSVKAYPQDVKRPVEFESELDLTGDVLTATAYAADDTPTDVTSGAVTSTGVPAGETNIVMCDFSSLAAGDYKLVITTPDLVVSKSILIMFKANAYEIE